MAINIRREYASFRQSDLGGRQREEPLREREKITRQTKDTEQR